MRFAYDIFYLERARKKNKTRNGEDGPLPDVLGMEFKCDKVKIIYRNDIDNDECGGVIHCAKCPHARDFARNMKPHLNWHNDIKTPRCTPAALPNNLCRNWDT